MRICISQLNPTIGAIAQNTAKIIQEIHSARNENADLIIFPELAICGYPLEDLLEHAGFIEAMEVALEEIITHTQSITVILGLPRNAKDYKDKPFYNSAAVIENQKLLGYQDKTSLPTYDIFDERRFFRPAAEQMVWDIKEKKIGITICEDIWSFLDPSRQESYPYDPLSYFEKAAVKIDVLINISASPYAVDKLKRRMNVLQTAAMRVNCPLIFCNQVGAQDGIIFDGTSSVMSASGTPLLQAKSFTEDHLVFDLEALQPSLIPIEDPAAELFSALVMGLRDYFIKQGFKKACLGLSGGIDSSLVACIAVAALGKENVTGVLLPSRFTSIESTEDALYVAGNLDIDTLEIPIEQIFTSCLDTLHPIFGEKSFDIVEENLQARIRGTLLMSLANKEGCLLLNTSNKSELAVGYSTLYGDTNGAISVIGDLLKRQVVQVSEWIMHTFGWIPPRIIQKAPTAELRENQKDSDSLPEYSILDSIIEEYVVHSLFPDAIAEKCHSSKEFVAEIIHKIHLNEYKRRQCPFALRVSEKAFSTGRKVPIVHRFFY
ncbi:MAG: synthetase [Chlamydiia bacterium]|nr:synthetase [Chlamydiia bacterium]